MNASRWLAERLFGLALLAYPRAFRRRFGDEMRDDFRRRAGTGGRLAATIGALLKDGLTERGAADRPLVVLADSPTTSLRTVRETRDDLGQHPLRPPLHHSPGRAGPALHVPRGQRARPRHRRQQRHLHRRPGRAPQAASLSGPRPAGHRLEPQHRGEQAGEPDLSGQLRGPAR